jgi:Ca2+-binding EF-hand superfamily protein
MFKTAMFTALLLVAGVAGAQSTNDFATGNMHFDAKDMDTNHDGMVSKDEMMAYGEKMWGMMTKGASTLSVTDAAKDFAQGNLRFNVRAMDADHDGTITKDEFMKYTAAKFDKMKGSNGMVSVADASTAFSRGNMHK